MTTFRTMRSDDIPAGLSLCRAAGWNQLSRDWELFVNVSPEGCRVAIDDSGKVVGTVTTVRYEDRFSWIGMVLVDPDKRRQGIGINLLKESLRILQYENTVKLDATPAGREVYLKLDFRDEYYLSRMHCASISAKPLNETSVRLVKEEDLPGIFEYDRKAFGAKRDKVLEWMWKGAPELAYAFEKGGKILGYCFCRHGYNHTHIGPVVSRDELIAKQLVSAVLAKCSGKSAIIDAPHRSRAWQSWLEKNGFAEQRPFMRMFLGDNKWPGRPEHQFAILGPEFG
jgi:GNAT superfamily N-acetyltransferase